MWQSLVTSVFGLSTGGDAVARSVIVGPAGGRHATVVGAERFLVVGDVHGCLDELELLLDKARYDAEKTRLVLVGDLVNKGPKSAAVVRWCRERDVLCVRGNHDDHAVAHWQKHADGEAVPEKYAYVRDLSDEDGAWLAALPHTLSLPAVDAVVVHAGLVPHTTLADQTPRDMTRMRSLLADGTASDAPGDASWAELRAEAPLVVFGHDAKRGLQVHAHAIGLDSGCCYGKQLTGLFLGPGGDRAFVAVDALHMYSEPDDLAKAKEKKKKKKKKKKKGDL